MRQPRLRNAAAARPILDPPPTAWDRAVEALMAGLLGFAPLAFGATEPWSQEVVLALTAAMALIVCLRLAVRPDVPAAWSWGFVPIVLFVGLVALQAVPLPAGLLRAIAPNAVALKAELLADPGAAAPAAGAGPAPLTFYRWATLRDLRLLLVPATLFWVVLNVYRTPAQVRRLLLTMTLAGLASALVAAYQNVTGDRTIYGTVPAIHLNSGPFMNYSHFGQFVNLSIGAALGVLLTCAADDDEDAAGGTGRPWSRPWLRWALGGTIVLGATTVVLSLTRGGTTSMLIAGTAVGVLLTVGRRTRGRGTLLAALGLLLLGALLYAGFDRAYERMATLRNVRTADNGRWDILQDLWATWRLHPVLGTGLGTHEVVFPAYKRAVLETLTTHAENEYAELMEETGLVGLALAAAFLSVVAGGFVRALRGADRPMRTAAFGLGFGLLAILIHSATDFGQHVPAVAAMTAVTCALLVRLGRPARAAADAARERPGGTRPTVVLRRWPRAARGALAGAAVLTVGGWALAGADGLRRGAAAWDVVAAIGTGVDAHGWGEASNDELAGLLDAAESAVALDPGNANYRYGLDLFRWRAISRITVPDTGEVLLTPETMGHARAIVADLQAAEALCPPFGLTHSLAGQVRWFVLADPAGKAEIRRGFRLAPYHNAVCVTAGHLEAQEGNWDAAKVAFTRAIRLNSNYVGDVFHTCVRGGRADVARALADGDRNLLLTLAAELDGSNVAERPTPDAAAAAPEGPNGGAPPRRDPSAAELAMAIECRREAGRLLEASAGAADAPPALLVALAERREKDGNAAAAIELYRRALAGEYGQVEWRMRLAKLLAAAGRPDEAVREARLCLRLRPHMGEASALIAALAGADR